MSAATLPLLERGGYVVLEHSGGLWGVSGRAVRRLAGRGGHLRLRVEGGELDAERILAVVPDLTVRPAPAVLERYWPEVASGLAVFAERPVLVIDAAHPPRLLLAEGGGEDLQSSDVDTNGTDTEGGHGDAGSGG